MEPIALVSATVGVVSGLLYFGLTLWGSSALPSGIHLVVDLVLSGVAIVTAVLSVIKLRNAAFGVPRWLLIGASALVFMCYVVIVLLLATATPTMSHRVLYVWGFGALYLIPTGLTNIYWVSFFRGAGPPLSTSQTKAVALFAGALGVLSGLVWFAAAVLWNTKDPVPYIVDLLVVATNSASVVKLRNPTVRIPRALLIGSNMLLFLVFLLGLVLVLIPHRFVAPFLWGLGLLYLVPPAINSVYWLRNDEVSHGGGVGC